MNKFTTYFIIFLVPMVCCSQPIYLLKDKKYVNHWEQYANCCIHIIDTGCYRGVILDGKQLALNDSLFMPNIHKIMQMDNSVDFNYHPTIAEISRTLSDKDFMFFISRNLQINRYLCQYIGLTSNDRKMLLVTFQRDDSMNKSKRIQRKAFELFKLIYSRIFFVKPFDSRGDNDGFALLYDVEDNQIVSIMSIYY